MQPTQLGPYVIDRQIGKGGMGSVYRAAEPESGQLVAIKALNAHLAGAEGFRERFEAEIESLKTLRHEGIVRLYGFGEQDGTLFYSMELIEGPSLEDELKAGRRFDWREVTEIAIQLCGALKHAHDHGIIHRDIKPANILFADERHVKVADFGIARLFGTTSSLTTAGGVLGTADYMSPEQADGRPVTARCDQYSLGGVMYALLAGRPPFKARTLPEMLQLQRFAEPEPVGRYAPDTPKQLEGVIGQLLAKDPADRFPNTAVLARHLQAMVMALTRPSHDSFSLAPETGNSPLSGPDLHNTLAMAVTQAEREQGAGGGEQGREVEGGGGKGEGGAGSAVERAALVHGAETIPAEGAGEAAGSGTSKQGAGSKEQGVAEGGRGSGEGGVQGGSKANGAVVRPSVFTTVEEDLARRQHESARSWVSVVGPLVGLGLVLAGLSGVGYYLTRPQSADQLYAKIAPRIESGEVEDMRTVEREIGEFVARFPEDARSAELVEHQQRLELDKMRRQLQRHRGGLADPSLVPVEVLYLEAMNAADSSPERAIEMLDGLVRLYGAENLAGGASAKETDDRTRKGVQLAERQLAQLRSDVAELNERRTVVLRERLAAADRLDATDPQAAQTIRRAVVDLYDHQPWAAALVAEARKKLPANHESDD
ncbi:MAG: serine/threonine-protein kinase [Pirellulales bacterium]